MTPVAQDPVNRFPSFRAPVRIVRDERGMILVNLSAHAQRTEYLDEGWTLSRSIVDRWRSISNKRMARVRTSFPASQTPAWIIEIFVELLFLNLAHSRRIEAIGRLGDPPICWKF